ARDREIRIGVMMGQIDNDICDLRWPLRHRISCSRGRTRTFIIIMRAHLFGLLIVSASVIGCRTMAPPIVRFAPPGTDQAHLHQDFPLSDAERLSLTPDNV